MSNVVFGIHIGNSSASIAVHRDGKTDVVANESGKRVTSTHLGLCSAKPREFCYGQSAARLAIRQPSAVLQPGWFASFSGQSTSARETEHILTLDNGDAAVCLSTVDVLRMLLQFFFDIASVHSESIFPVVLSVPRRWSSDCRSELIAIARSVGFSPLQVITYEAAIFIAHDLCAPSTVHRSIVVVRIGGLTTDASLVRVTSDGLLQTLDTESGTVGGSSATEALSDYLASKIHKNIAIDDLSTRARNKIRHASAYFKHCLSVQEATLCSVESVCDGLDLDVNVTRARFNSLLTAVVKDILAPLDALLERSRAQDVRFDGYLLCGGSAKIPLIEKLVQDRLSVASVGSHIVCDEVISIGCAKQAAELANVGLPDDAKLGLACQVNCLSNISVGIRLDGAPCLQRLINSGRLLPCTVTSRIQSANNVGTIHVVAVNHETDAEIELGKITMPGDCCAQPGAEQIGLQNQSIKVSIDSAGLIDCQLVV